MPTASLKLPPVTWNRAQAWTILIACIAFTAWSLLALYGPRESSSAPTQQGGKDLETYRRIVERVHHGENYYAAAGDELRAGGYATSSVFNWRPPTYAWFLAAFPWPECGQALLCLLAVLALGLDYNAERRESGILRASVLVVAMIGAFLWCVDGDAFLSQELWAGVLIAVSVGAFAATGKGDGPHLPERPFGCFAQMGSVPFSRRAVGLRGWGVAAGLAALFMRELAAPYVLVALVLACREKRWREMAVWCAGLAVFAVYFVWHAWQVQQHLTRSEFAETDGWIQFGGPAFVIQTCQMNVWLFKAPAWIALAYLLASGLGLVWWRGPLATRVGATVAVYLAAFLIVGKPFNAYWGLLYVALLPFGLVRFPSAVLALFPAIARSFGPRLSETAFLP